MFNSDKKKLGGGPIATLIGVRLETINGGSRDIHALLDHPLKSFIARIGEDETRVARPLGVV